MAEIIPPLTREIKSRMTSGEKRFAEKLKDALEDDYLCWFDIRVGEQRRYPDFIILHPSRGLLFIEVKDWKVDTIKKISKSRVTLNTPEGLVEKDHPLEQARQCAYQVLNQLKKDKQLTQRSGKHKGNLAMPYGWGVVFSNITRKQVEKAGTVEEVEHILPEHLVMYKDDIGDAVDAETFQSKLWGMFNYTYGETLALPQIDRIRAHLFPELIIGEQGSLFAQEDQDEEENLPALIRIMDVQQEKLAKGLGSGHRVIHGVAGSGKTMILGYRCLHLAKIQSKPILILCFNISLAAKLRAFISEKGIDARAQVYHFHDWCSEQIRTYNVDVTAGEAPVWERKVATVIDAVDKGRIPRAQYGALLIDEGHDFEASWLKLVVQMVDPESNSLLLLYDDAQSIYKYKNSLGFSLSSVGIEAKGRTSILRINYRNTREILNFAYDFSKDYFNPIDADDDHIPLIEPQPAGVLGEMPAVRQCRSFNHEIEFIIKCLRAWHSKGVNWKDVAILYPHTYLGELITQQLSQHAIPHYWLGNQQQKKKYNPSENQIAVLTVHSSKGLEFPYVIIAGVGHLHDQEDDDRQKNARLLYVGMTRAQEKLLLTTSQKNSFSEKLFQISNNYLELKNNV